MVPAQHYPTLSTAVFCIGTFGLLARRNTLLFLMSIELTSSATNINLVTSSYCWGNVTDQTFGPFTMVLTIIEVVIGIGIVLVLYRNFDGVDVTNATTTRW